MAETALILTYHAVEHGPAPLCIEPSLFRAHLDCLDEAGAHTLTITELAETLRAGALRPRSVALTFDDAFGSVVSAAAPLLADRGRTATIFCVAGHLGGMNDWPTQPAGVPRRRLATAQALAQLAEAGLEIGSHGMEHFPLGRASGDRAQRELLGSKLELERTLGLPVRSFAFPYGVTPTRHGRSLLESLYSAACAGGLRRADGDADVHALPRVDAYYLRRPGLLRCAVEGRLDALLAARRAGARARRLLHRDYRLDSHVES